MHTGPVISQGLAELQDALDETARARRSTGHTEKRHKQELDLVMDYLINAENRAGLECRWKVFDVCFENSAAEEWREQMTAAVYGWHHLYDIGPSIMMCSAMLECIVDCTHHHKLSSIQDLKRETGWLDADQYGGEILSLIQRHIAPLASPFISTPLQQTISPPNVLATSHANPSVGWCKVKCSTCGQDGHNARNRICSRHPSHVGTVVGKENVCFHSDIIAALMQYYR
ncbi:hypothetical protein EDD16DRAFT_1479995 [Pisolithus croceorrhizus]|nr:hypothetical protein EV401DRAFT_1870093 [Pisolithus croceorrhizus]KAI6119772.1 hypothetical protein EDD16DRAFT_1479995 [Pisolithus croceorrhizus]KAI6161334.1 hypothetical protein EDD17DRAFT_1481991 [Pisolithus thermaeus]